MGIEDWSSTAASNNSSPPNGAPEGMSPSSLNDTIRQIMADIRAQHEQAQWIDWGDVPTRTGNTTFTIAANVTSRYTVGRRIRCTDSSTLYGTISASSYSSPNTTVTVTLDSGNLSASLSAVALGILTPSSNAIPSPLTLSGGQIAFPATQNASSGANTLDDYEEGTWTPVLTFATPGDLSVSYTTQAGTYTKIGRLVTLSFNILTSSFTHSTASGALTITGAPFTNLSALAVVGPAAWRGITKANYTDLAFHMTHNTTNITTLISGSGQAPANVAPGDMPSGGTVLLYGNLTYHAS